MATQTLPVSGVIGTISFTPPLPVPGESVLVEVHPPNASPSATPYIAINGVPGSRKYLQFASPGEHTVLIDALGPDGVERQTITVRVVDPATAPVEHATDVSARFALHRLPDLGVSMLDVVRRPYGRYLAAFALGDQSPLAPLQRFPLTMIPLGLTGFTTPPEYEWDFGDGQRVGTRQPYVEHNFEPSLDFEQEVQHFDVRVTWQGRSVVRTVSVFNSYVQLKKLHGVLHPLTSNIGYAGKFGAGYHGTVTVQNHEPAPITLSEYRVVPMVDDPGTLTVPTATQALTQAVTVPPKGSASIPIHVSFDDVPSDAAGFSVYLAGVGPGAMPVRASAHFDIDPQDRATSGILMEHIALSSALRDLVAQKLTKSKPSAGTPPPPKPNGLQDRTTTPKVDYAQIRTASSNAAHLTTLSSSAADVASHPIARRMQSDLGIDVAQLVADSKFHPIPLPQPAAPQIGAVCDPDNLPDDLPAGVACAMTSVQQTIPMSGRFMNARKGDLVLAPAGTGLIGGLLRQVTPPQKYSHCGIMTLNHTQITHCTADEDRYQAYPVGSIIGDGPEPVDGFRPDIVKYGWPGVVTQTVENAIGDPSPPYGGETFADPDPAASKKAYPLGSSFGSQPSGMDLQNQWVIVLPHVVKPDPMLETADLRTQLHVIADDAAAQTGKAHYRFYCYTDPTIGQTQTAPADAGWAAGTFPAVCSSFIWLMMKRHGVHLLSETDVVVPNDLTSGDVEAGAAVDATTPDGLFFYSEAQRQTAGSWFNSALQDKVWNSIQDKAGSAIGTLLEFATEIKEHVANEYLNSFGSDTTQTDDDNLTWQHPGGANAVSPDNLQLWKGPDRFGGAYGLFGFAEPLIYREPRVETVNVYRYAQVAQYGTLTGQVTSSGSPVSGATVQLNDALTAFTDDSGNYSLPNVPYGKWVVNAQSVGHDDGTFFSAAVPIDLESPTLQQEIALEPPSDLYRTVHITGTFHTHYHWSDIVNTEDKSNDQPFYCALNVGPDGTHKEQLLTNDVEDAKPQFHLTLDWQVDKSVNVSFTFALHEKQVSNSFNVAQDCWASWTASKKADNDDANVAFTVSNDLEQA